MSNEFLVFRPDKLSSLFRLDILASVLKTFNVDDFFILNAFMQKFLFKVYISRNPVTVITILFAIFSKK